MYSFGLFIAYRRSFVWCFTTALALQLIAQPVPLLPLSLSRATVLTVQHASVSHTV